MNAKAKLRATDRELARRQRDDGLRSPLAYLSDEDLVALRRAIEEGDRETANRLVAAALAAYLDERLARELGIQPLAGVEPLF